MGAQDKGTGVQKDTGVPEPASESKVEQTAPQGIDLATEITVNKRGEKKTISDLITEANRGNLFDKAQSDLHKTQEQLKSIQSEFDITKKELEEYRQEKSVADQLKKLGIGASVKPKEDDWLTSDEKETAPALDAKEIARLIQSIQEEALTKRMGDVGKTVAQIVQEELTKTQAEREKQERRRQWATNVRQIGRASCRERV